ncbi:MAG: Fur family transcriptional regulator [Ardenticatenaceae bacterium]
MKREALIEQLRGVGYRMTGQREALLDVIWGFEGHFTVEMVRAALEERTVAVDLSTVYRTLELLCDLQVLHQLAGSSPTEFERVAEPHHHLVCQECGAVTPLADYHFDGLLRHLLEEHDFLADFTHLAIPGRCHDCRASNPST